MRLWLFCLMLAVLGTSNAGAQSAMTADQAYVRAMTYMQQELGRVQADLATRRVLMGADTAALNERLAAAEEELARLRVQASQFDDAGAQQALAAFASGQGTKGLDALEDRARAFSARANKQSAEDWKGVGEVAAVVDIARATMAFEEAVKLAPEDYESWVYLGEAYSFQGDYKRAIEATTKSLAYAPAGYERLDVLLSMARLHLLASDTAAAKSYFDQFNEAIGVLLKAPEVKNGVIFADIRYQTLFAEWVRADGDLQHGSLWYENSIRYLEGQRGDPTFSEDATVALLAVLTDATVTAVRLGNEASARENSSKLLALHKDIAATLPQPQGNIGVVLAMTSAAGTETRFGNLDMASNYVEQATSGTAKLRTADASNLAYRRLDAAAIVARSFVEILRGNAKVAALHSDKAISEVNQLVGQDDPQALLLKASSYVYGGLAAWTAGDRSKGDRLVRHGRETYLALLQQKKGIVELMPSIWAMDGICAMLGVGRSWDDFLVASARLKAAGAITTSEIEYATELRQNLIKLYPTALK